MATPIASRVVPSVEPADLSPSQVDRELRRRLAEGATIRPSGEARENPLGLLSGGYGPKHKIELFDTTFFLTNVRQNQDIRFFVAYVAQPPKRGARPSIYPRIFYKDVSLVWRSASHFVQSDEENWIGKGDTKPIVRDGEELVESVEATTELPLEIQTALETLIRKISRVPTDHVAVPLVLRRGPDDRVEPYAEFTDPRRRAQADPRNLIHGGRNIAWFARKNDPASLKFARGFEPDFDRGIVETAQSVSRLYGGKLRRFRIVSKNQKIQYLFFAGPRQVWIAHPQATTTELSSFGVRTIDVIADEDAFLPAYEYHFMDDFEDPPVLVSQIPKGFVGRPSELDPSRSDASPWIDRMPVVQEFRKRVLRRRRG